MSKNRRSAETEEVQKQKKCRNRRSAETEEVQKQRSAKQEVQKQLKKRRKIGRILF